MTNVGAVPARRVLLSKVPEVTAWFWIIKILCTTVGESFADWVNITLGVGLNTTALIFTAVLGVVLAWQVSLDAYVPFVYWLTVVVLSVTGTLYTDILTDSLGVPLVLSTSVFAAVLAVVFGVWFARERTLSIHSIITRPRECFYWLAVLVTFALGTAIGDWTLELTGWGPGISVLLPAGLIAVVVVGWRRGANPVLAFWLAYILTRPLGANLGDWLASPSTDGGLGLGTAITSVIFLAAILATVVYLTRTRGDVIENTDKLPQSATTRDATRERIMLGYYALAAVGTAVLLVWAAGQPHAVSADTEEVPDTPSVASTEIPEHVAANFPPAEMEKFHAIVTDTLAKVRAGDQPAAKARIKDLETAWDDAEDTLRPMNEAGWPFIDGRIDVALKAVRADHPDSTIETRALNELLKGLQ